MPSSEKVTLTGGEAVVAMLKRFNVKMMFGLPGDQTDIYDALYRSPGIRHVLVRHEQAAAHMADAYARTSGLVGVCDASVGPGATNLISGISEAYTSGVPVIAIISDIRTDWRGRDSFQEIDQVGVFKPVTKKALTVGSVGRIPEFVSRSFQIATTGRPGPVVLNFPIDVLKASNAFLPSELKVDERYGRWPANRLTPPRDDIVEAVDALFEARRPVILAGGGVLASGAWLEVRDLAELMDIPVATTFMGKGSISENHPLAIGPFGLIGRPATNEYVLGADLALALGTRFTNVDTAAWKIPDRKTKIVQIDIEPTQIGRNYFTEHALPGDIRTVLRAMLEIIASRNVPARGDSRRNEVSELMSKWRRNCEIECTTARDSDMSAIHPLLVVRALRKVMAPNDVIVCDSGFNQIWGGQYFEIRCAGRHYVGPRGFGVMGFSLPAAISHALAKPRQKVVALCGDGGFAMVIQELETALRERAGITICIMNNSSLQFIQDNQRLLFGSRFISTEFSELDFASIARSFGCLGIRVERGDELESALEEAVSSDLPSVVDIRTSSSVVPERTSLQNLD